MTSHLITLYRYMAAMSFCFPLMLDALPQPHPGFKSHARRTPADATKLDGFC